MSRRRLIMVWMMIVLYAADFGVCLCVSIIIQ